LNQGTYRFGRIDTRSLQSHHCMNISSSISLSSGDGALFIDMSAFVTRLLMALRVVIFVIILILCGSLLIL
jgi:hypothetical protein